MCRWLFCPLLRGCPFFGGGSLIPFLFRGMGSTGYQAYPSIMRDCIAICRGICHTIVRALPGTFVLVILPKAIFCP